MSFEYPQQFCQIRNKSAEPVANLPEPVTNLPTRRSKSSKSGSNSADAYSYYYYYYYFIIIIIIITIIIIIGPLGQMECKQMRSKYEKAEVDLETPRIAISIYI